MCASPKSESFLKVKINKKLQAETYRWAHSKLQSFEGQLKCTVDIAGAILLVASKISSPRYPMGELTAMPARLFQHGSSTLL